MKYINVKYIFKGIEISLSLEKFMLNLKYG